MTFYLIGDQVSKKKKLKKVTFPHYIDKTQTKFAEWMACFMSHSTMRLDIFTFIIKMSLIALCLYVCECIVIDLNTYAESIIAR